jgi:hypothetical protein
MAIKGNEKKGPSSKPRLTPTPKPNKTVRSGEPNSSIALSFISHGSKLIKEHFKDHLVLAKFGSVVLLLGFILFLVLRKPADCLEVDTHFLGNIRVGCSHLENLFPAALADGLHGNSYTDREAAFTLQLDEPSNWSIVQAETTADETRPGKSANAFKFAAGLLGEQNITILTNDGVVAFLYSKRLHQGKANLWVFRIPNQTTGVEQFVAAETDKLLRTGAVVVTLVAPLVSDPFRSKSTSVYQESPTRRVQLTRMKISPDHRNAVLLWESPVWGVNADIIARAIVGKRDTYYVIAIRVAPLAANEEKVNQQLRTMLQSFRPL